MISFLENDFYYALFLIYGEELTKTQQEIFKDHFFSDLSLQEISEIKHISKSAVEDALNKAKRKLELLEKHLEVYHRKLIAMDLLLQYKETKDERKLELLEKVLKNGI